MCVSLRVLLRSADASDAGVVLLMQKMMKVLVWYEVWYEVWVEW